MSLVDFERADRAKEELGKVTHHLAVNPVLYLAVVLSNRVGAHHQLIAVPPVSLRQKLGHRVEVWVLVRVRQPISLVADAAGKGFNTTVGIPMVAIIAALLGPINVEM